MLDIAILHDAISRRNVKDIADIINKFNLKIVDNKIKADKKELKYFNEYWDKRQETKKLKLNGSYGSLLAPSCRFFDLRLGQSTTLSGRQTVKHMSEEVNEIITGTRDHVGNAVHYNDTDSEIGTTMHQTNGGDRTIEDLFENCSEFWEDGDKEYAYDPDLMVMSYDQILNEPYLSHINYIYRHKVTKDLYEIMDDLGNIITVTEDHSVMVERNNILIEVRPQDILDNDILISILSSENGADNYKKRFADLILTEDEDAQKLSLEYIRQGIPKKTISLHKGKMQSIKKIRKAEDEYVYDIGMKNESNPWYFGNNILIHNSIYFSAYSTLKTEIEAGKIEWNKDSVVKLYDQICDDVNDSFAPFMLKAFNCPIARGSIIKAGREIVAIKGLFITKKRYAVLVYDKEGKRKDKDGKLGEIKVTGLDLKRSDTPEFMQNFLSEILEMVLTGTTEKAVLDKITEFRMLFKQRPGWEKGSPKRANNVTKYQALEEKQGKANIPGHVRAGINWNVLKNLFGDKYSMNVIDGSKVIVCKLKANPLGFTSVAYPVDELRLPQWFKDLPFEHSEMEAVIIDKKISNLIGVLNWDLLSTNQKTSADELFTFY